MKISYCISLTKKNITGSMGCTKHTHLNINNILSAHIRPWLKICLTNSSVLEFGKPAPLFSLCDSSWQVIYCRVAVFVRHFLGGALINPFLVYFSD